MTASSNGAGFVQSVRSEARATWCARFRWIWRALGLAAIALAIFAPKPGLDSPAFPLFCALAYWVPAWLGSDLLAIRFKANPDPLREWKPQEFLARAVGRLMPFLAVQCLWLAIFTSRGIAARALQGQSPQFVDPLHDAAWSSLPMWCVAWTAVFTVSGFPYFAGAALLSGLARRPRLPAVTIPVALVGSAVLLLTTGLLPVDSTGNPFHRVSELLGDPSSFLQIITSGVVNVWVGLFSAEGLSRLMRLSTTGDKLAFPILCGLASAAFVLYSLPCALGVWWLAARRYRSNRFHPIATTRSSAAPATVESTS